jgi:hypothetical protein
MATVIGKTSERIDQLLANLVVNAEISGGHLFITFRDGAVSDLGPIGGGGSSNATDVAYTGSTNISASNVEGALDELDAEKAPLNHTHDDRYFTESEVTTLLADKSDNGHTHDGRYYTEAEVDTLLASRAKVYKETLGALTAGSWTTVTHNLNTDTPIASFVSVDSSEGMIFDWKVTSVNAIQVRTDISFLANKVRVCVVG